MKKFKLTEEQMSAVLEYYGNNASLDEAITDSNEIVSFKIGGLQGKEQFYVNFNLDPKHGDDLTKKVKGFRKNSKINKSYFLSGPLYAKDAFFKGSVLPQVLKYLSDVGYDVPSLDELKTKADTELRLDIITPADKVSAKENYDNLIVKILSNLNDQKMRDLISKASNLRVTQDIMDEAFGHVFSGKNVLRALAAKPDATFLATRKNWLSKYNRLVKPDATKIILFVNFGGGKFDQDKAEKMLGVKKDDAYQSAQMRHKFDIVAQSTDSSSSFMAKLYYDISDTYLVPGLADNDADLAKFDKVTNEPGLLDNLQGILNQAAINMKGVNLSPEDKAKIGAKDTSNKNVMVFSRVFNYMKDIAIRDRLLKPVVDSLINLDPNDDNSVYRVIKNYFMTIGFDRASDDKELKSNIATAGVLSMNEIAPTALAALLSSNPNILKLDKPDIVNVFDKIMELQNKVITTKNVIDNPTMKNESDEIMESKLNSPEDLVALFGYKMSDLGGENTGEEDSEILKEFYDIYNKINKTISLNNGN